MFNNEAYVEEFNSFITNKFGSKLESMSVLEVGCLSKELTHVFAKCEGIDLEPKYPGVIKADIFEFNTNRYDLVFSSGVLEHYSINKALAMLKAKAKLLNKDGYILTIVPNTNCAPYMRAKAISEEPWKDELDFSEVSLAELHQKAGLFVVETGTFAQDWAKVWGLKEDEEDPAGYLVYCLAKKEMLVKGGK